MGTLHDTTEAVKTLLAAGSFSKSIDPQFVYDTELPLEDLDTLRVDVVAASLVQVPDSRVSVRYEVGVDVAVRYRFGVADQTASTGDVTLAAIEGYVDLLEELAEYLADPDNRVPSTKTAAVWVGNEMRVPWVPEHLRQNRQYTGIFRATYQVMKDL